MSHKHHDCCSCCCDPCRCNNCCDPCRCNSCCNPCNCCRSCYPYYGNRFGFGGIGYGRRNCGCGLLALLVILGLFNR